MVILFGKYVISGGEMKAIAKMSIKSSWPTHVNTQNKTDNYVISACFEVKRVPTTYWINSVSKYLHSGLPVNARVPTNLPLINNYYDEEKARDFYAQFTFKKAAELSVPYVCKCLLYNVCGLCLSVYRVL